MTLVEFDGGYQTRTEFNTIEELKAYVIPKYNIDMENTYEEFPESFEDVNVAELETAREIDELAGYYDEYSYGYWIGR